VNTGESREGDKGAKWLKEINKIVLD
jgi:hypothetical protein